MRENGTSLSLFLRVQPSFSSSPLVTSCLLFFLSIRLAAAVLCVLNFSSLSNWAPAKKGTSRGLLHFDYTNGPEAE